jgi:hypothetical protein
MMPCVVNLRKAERVEQRAVSSFRGDVGRPGVGERVGPQACQRRDRRGADEAVDQHRDVPPPCRQRRAEDGGELAAAERRRDLQGIAEQRPVSGERGIDRRPLAREALVVDAGAAAGPALAAA